MKTFHVTIYIVIFVLGATALWYFGHHRPVQQNLNAPPKIVYKVTTPVLKDNETAKATAHPKSRSYNNDNLGTPDTQTETRLTTEQKTDTSPMETPNVEGQPTMANENKFSTHENTEGEHGLSQEEAEAKRAEAEARRTEREAARQSNLEFLENAEIIKLQMAGEMAAHFNALSLEEQQAHFKMFERIVYQEIPGLHPGEDTQEDLDRLWNNVLSSLILVGYTPPEGFTLK